MYAIKFDDPYALSIKSAEQRLDIHQLGTKSADYL